jgi:Ribonuclease G/E
VTEPTDQNPDTDQEPVSETSGAERVRRAEDRPDRDGERRRRRRGGRGRGGRDRREGDGAERGGATGDRASRDDGSPQGDSGDEASGSDTSRQDASRQGASQEGASQKDVSEGGPGDASREAGSGDAASGGEDASSRRRRRGRRGRGGRGRGGGTSGTASDGAAPNRSGDARSDAGEAEARGAAGRARSTAGNGSPGGGAERGESTGKGEDTADGGDAKGGTAKGDATKGGTAKGGTAKGGTAKGGSAKGGSAKAGATKGGAASRGSAGEELSAEDQATADAIAKGGTRAAAKGKGGRRGGNGNGNGNGGRGRGQRPGGVPEEVRRAILEGPPRTMLVTNRGDRTQLGVLEDRTIVEHYVTRKKDVTFVGNIYMARVQNVLPGMEAAFLDIGKGRNGVLYAGEVLYDELDLEEGADERIENALKPGQKVLVQVTKDPMGSKGPRLTMHLSLAGRYSVLAPNSDLFGISRKLTDRERDRLRRIVKKVKPDEHGVIVRTAAENASEDQLTADLERLLAKWARVEEAVREAKALESVYEEPPLVVKVIRDNFGPEFERCVVDDEDLYHQVRGYLDEVAPELTAKVELYGQPTADARARAAGAPALEDAAADPGTADVAAVVEAPPSTDAPGAGEQGPVTGADPHPVDAPETAGASDAAAAPVDDASAAGTHRTVVPAVVDLEAARARRETLPKLFDAYAVTDQLRKATSRKVWLPSGGYLIIESTEAMQVIDVNSGKFTGNGDMNLEEVVLRTNLEAADEIVRQLRLRDMGGIIVIDFIDMLLKANQDQVVRRLKRELLRDRTKTRVSEVSRLGLVQMTRKNVSQGLVEAFSHACEACEGRGLISELD